jgi:uncharacterized protein
VDQLIILTTCFFVIAMIYASVGFGGGSSYLALLGQPVFLLSQDVIRPTALFCNIIVVTGGAIIFYREKKIDWKEMWPFLVASVPLAWLGGYLRLKDDVFYSLLAITLIVSSLFLWIQTEAPPNTKRFNNTPVNMALGGGIGFLSGLVSIGGGIFLSPVLHLLRWAEAKKISALATLFILVNSISGLAGQFSRGIRSIDAGFLAPLLVAVLIGGQLGSRLGAKKFNPIHIKRITAVLIFIAGVNILRDYL